MTKVIAVTNRKGGVGKSTISAHLSAGLAALGNNVGLIDADAQGHSSKFFGMPRRDGLYDALIEQTPLSEVVYSIPADRYSTEDHPSTGNLYLLPGHTRTAKAARSLEPQDTFLFAEIVDDFATAGRLDYVIIDTQPSISNLDTSIYLAVDGFLYVTDPEALAIDGVQTAIKQLNRWSDTREKHTGRGISIVGIQPNRMHTRTSLHRQNLQDLAAHYDGLVWPPLMNRTVWGRAVQMEQTVFTYAPSSPAALEAWAMIKRAEGVLVSWPNR